MTGEKEMWVREAKDDMEAWSAFKAGCVYRAEQQWLEMMKMRREVVMMRKELIKMEEQVSSLYSTEEESEEGRNTTT